MSIGKGLSRLTGVVAAAVTLVLFLSFSLVLLMVAIAGGAMVWAYLWWRTRKLRNGDTEWIPPPHLPLKGGVNSYHHPERFLRDREGP